LTGITFKIENTTLFLLKELAIFTRLLQKINNGRITPITHMDQTLQGNNPGRSLIKLRKRNNRLETEKAYKTQVISLPSTKSQVNSAAQLVQTPAPRNREMAKYPFSLK
jgi:LysM repeat protein